MENFSEDPGNESYPEILALNFSYDKSRNFSATLSSKSKFLKKKIRNTGGT